jgi:hypothetical protein
VASAPVVVTPEAPEPKPSMNKSKVAALVPSTFAQVILLILQTWSASTVINVAVAVLVKLNPALPGRTDDTFIKSTFAIYNYLLFTILFIIL